MTYLERFNSIVRGHLEWTCFYEVGSLFLEYTYEIRIIKKLLWYKAYMKIIDKLADEYSYNEDNYRVYDRGDIAKAFRAGFRKCRSIVFEEIDSILWKREWNREISEDQIISLIKFIGENEYEVSR